MEKEEGEKKVKRPRNENHWGTEILSHDFHGHLPLLQTATPGPMQAGRARTVSLLCPVYYVRNRYPGHYFAYIRGWSEYTFSC